MRRFSPHRMLRLVGTALAAVLTAALPTACESIYDELDPCRVGVSLRFVYDYNMEFANAFPRKVDCLTVLVYDADDRWVETRTVTGPELADEEYRMVLDLEPGEYTISWQGSGKVKPYVADINGKRIKVSRDGRFSLKSPATVLVGVKGKNAIINSIEIK